MEKKRYVLMEYDTYFQDVRRTFTIECETEEEAIQKCKQAACNMHPLDSIEIQLYVDGLSKGELCMVGAAYYEDYEIVYDECFC